MKVYSIKYRGRELLTLDDQCLGQQNVIQEEI